jgi:hypothetical protein
MSGNIETENNTSLTALETLLFKVTRPGNFYMQGSREIPMPSMTVKGVGSLSFPIPEFQIEAMIKEASLAPYGRGEKTILDTSVRKTWQISPDHLQISGKSWEKHFDSILDEVTTGLGARDVVVTAELYKLLIYDEGSFFLPHRDSEKSSGMFGTMIIALPSFHTGGQLIVRHKNKEATIDLSGAEGSELKFGAFYADCEHEVLPITKGYRICLVYNLVQKTMKYRSTPPQLTAPCYDKEVQEASKMLQEAFSSDVQLSKLVWLLDHQYSSAELAFNTLKNKDAAIAQVLIKAAEQAHCAIHLGIVHIEECGGAEVDFNFYSSRSHRYYKDMDRTDVDSLDYEVIDIFESNQYIDGWVDTQNNQKNFGEIPIEDGEVLPRDALYDLEPDEQKLTEATGNAGVTFERAYRIAAIVLWPQTKTIKDLKDRGQC